MHAVCCIKQVPDTTEVKINRKTGTLERKGVPSIINPYDVHGVEEAVRLKEKYGGTVTLLSMGPPQARDALKKAMTFGADRAILLSSRVFAGSDTLATSYILAEALEKIDAEERIDLIFCGKQAIDGDTAQVGPGIATRTGVSQLTYVMEIEAVDFTKGEIIVQRKLHGARERVRARLPALLTVVKEINELRRASLPNMIKAARSEIEVWDEKDLDGEVERMGLKGSPTAVTKIFPPAPRDRGEIIAREGDDPEEAAARLVELLVVEKVIADI